MQLVMHPPWLGPWRCRYLLFALVCLPLVLGLSGPAAAQPFTDGSPVSPDAEDQAGSGTASTPRISQARPRPDDPPGGALERVLGGIDRGFAGAVDLVSKVLFYRVGARTRQYVQFDHQEYYVRDRGSDEPFQKLVDPASAEAPVSVTAREVRRLAALGQVWRDPSGEAIRPGRQDNRAVEYVTVPLDDSKYVLQEGTFRKVLPRLSQLSQSNVLDADEVARAASAGKLQTDPQKLAAGDPRPYLLEEPAGGAPLVVVWLATGAVFFTIYMRGYNVWGFRHAIDIVRGKYDNPNEPGEVTHFQALASALSATVGLGNIAGVTIAMTIGGPGAFFWMMACGVFGMTSKFVECTLGQKYRQVKPDGTVLGGPMQYLYSGLKELQLGGVGLGGLGLVLSIVFSVMCIFASFGGGNMFQANQSTQQMLSMFQRGDHRALEALDAQIKTAARDEDDTRLAQLQEDKAQLLVGMRRFATYFKPAFGVALAFMVGIVIIGGIRRIGAAAEKVVPSMCIVYICVCLWIIGHHIGAVPEMVAQILREAFTPTAFGGGLVGVLVVGVQRAAFSNEAGVGSAAIAHSAARTEEPVREGTVALMGPFIDTVVVCSMTALVILITGAWNNHQWVVEQGLAGTPLTSKAFEQEVQWFPYVLSIAVVMFAYSTLISWSYYGERCWERLFGARSTIVYKVLYLGATFVGAIANLGAVLEFSDMMILSMAFPNVLGLVLLSPKVRRDLADYWKRYKAGEFQTYA